MNCVRGKCLQVALGLAVFALLAGEARGQDLEPRRWTHLPTGLNVLGAGLGITDGDIMLDPVLRIEEGTFELYSLGYSFLRTFEWLGKSSRFDIRVPYAYGRWEGLLDGVYDSTPSARRSARRSR